MAASAPKSPHTNDRFQSTAAIVQALNGHSLLVRGRAGKFLAGQGAENHGHDISSTAIHSLGQFAVVLGQLVAVSQKNQ